MAAEQTILEEDYDENYQPTDDEIGEFAELIGIDPETEPHLMYIAREGFNVHLPHDWKRCQDTNGEIYYFNFTSGESIWDHPCNEYYKQIVSEQRSKRAQTESAVTDHTGATRLDAFNTPGLASLTAPGLNETGSLLDQIIESFGGIQMLSISMSEEETTNLEATSSANFEDGYTDVDSSDPEGYTNTGTLNKMVSVVQTKECHCEDSSGMGWGSAFLFGLGAAMATTAAAGFGVGGVMAGSLAAIYQSTVLLFVPILEGSTFAVMQSLGAHGLITKALASVGLGLAYELGNGCQC